MNNPFKIVVLGSLLLLSILVEAAPPGAGSSPLSSLEPRTLLFSRLSMEQGLSQATINAVVQDRRGYMWFGTQEGLNRYDGQDIKIYEHAFDEPDSMSNNWVWSLLVDDSGHLWAGTEGGGLNRYIPETDSFVHYRYSADNLNSLSSDRVRVLYQDREGIFWIGTDGGGLNRYDSFSKEFKRFQHNAAVASSLPNNSVLAIKEDRAGNLWVGTNGGGLSRLDRNSGEFTHFQHDPDVATSLSNNRVRALHEDRDGGLWVATYEGGLNRFDPATTSFQHFLHDGDDPASLSSNRVRSLFQDRDGTMWVATDAGLDEWRPGGQGFAHYVNDAAESSSLSDDRVISLYQDRGGVLWVGTYNGVNKWNYLSDAFTYFQATGTSIKLSNNVVTTLAESASGELWVGTYGGGLNRINQASGEVRYYARAPESADADQGLKDDRLMALHVDPQQNVWVGTRDGGLSMLNPDTNRFTHYMHDAGDARSLSGNSVTSILKDSGPTLWAGTYGAGLNRLDVASGEFTIFRHDPLDAGSISSDRVLAIYRDRRGVLWVGTEDGGLNRYDEASNSFVRYMHAANDSSSLSSNAAWAIHEGSDGSLWIGTNGGGLNRWFAADRDADRAVFKHYRKTDGLRSDTIQSILEDTAGQLWMSTNRGLAQLDPGTGRVRQYNSSSGLRGDGFNWAAAVRSRSNRLLFGGSRGLVAFYPHEIRSNRHQPDIAVSVLGRQGEFDTRYSVNPDGRPIEIGYRDDLVTFEFSGMDYSSPERVHYRYRLAGFDREWSKPTRFRRATYTNLPAGEYTFVVQAANSEGIWNETGVSMPLNVVPPPWFSPWAYAAYVLMLLGVVVVYLWTQSGRFEREVAQRQQLEKEVDERTHELAGRNEELLALNEKLKESSWTDSLTGLKNRRFLDEFIQNEVALAYRHAREMDLPEGMADSLDIAPALSFMMIDLDGFKAINDNFGHAAGDEALLQVRDVLQDSCRKSDTIIRWGGDEFLIIGRKTSNRAAEKVAERIREGLAERKYHFSDQPMGKLTGSIGFAVYPFSPLNPDLLEWEQVAGLADQCAYIAKQNGRNAWVGAFGNKDTTAEDVARFKTNPESVVKDGRIGIRTSIYTELKLPVQQLKEIT